MELSDDSITRQSSKVSVKKKTGTSAVNLSETEDRVRVAIGPNERVESINRVYWS